MYPMPEILSCAQFSSFQNSIKYSFALFQNLDLKCRTPLLKAFAKIMDHVFRSLAFYTNLELKVYHFFASVPFFRSLKSPNLIFYFLF